MSTSNLPSPFSPDLNSLLTDGASYDACWQTPLGITIGSFTFERSLVWVVNDGLMVIFFFVVGLEIRREIHRGELSEPSHTSRQHERSRRASSSGRRETARCRIAGIGQRARRRCERGESVSVR